MRSVRGEKADMLLPVFLEITDGLNVGKCPAPHPGEPLRQTGLAVRVIGCKVVQSLSGDDVHRREDVMPNTHRDG